MITVSDPDAAPDPRRFANRGIRVLLLVALMSSVFFAAPTVAQSDPDSDSTNPVCSDNSGTLTDMIEGFVQVTTGLGVMGLLVVWQADSLLEMITIGQERKRQLKQHKRSALKSAGTLVALGPVFTLGGSAMGLPIAECVDLIPF